MTQRRFAIAIVALYAILAVGRTASGEFASDHWTFAQERLTQNDPRLLDWTQDIARVEITTAAVGTRDHPPMIGFKVLEVIRAGYFPAPQSAIWLGDNVAGDTDWLAHQKNDTLDAWGVEVLRGPPVGTRALVLAMFDGEATLFSASGFFPDTSVNRSTASRFSATEPWSERLAHTMFFLVPVLLIAALAILRGRPSIAFLFAAATFPAFAFYNSHIPNSSNIRVDLLMLYPVLAVSVATMLGAVALIAWRYRKRRSEN